MCPGPAKRAPGGSAQGIRGRSAPTRSPSSTCPLGRGTHSLPAHRHLLVEAGVYIIEALDLEELADAAVREFTFVLSPLKLVGGTGSPARPLAIVTAGEQTP